MTGELGKRSLGRRPVVEPPRLDPGLDALLTELVDAHVDTLELLVRRGDATTAHVDYLQGLVRETKRLMAAWDH